MMRAIFQIIIFVIVTFTFAGCGSKKTRYEKKQPAKLNQKIEIRRYEKALFQLNPDSLENKITSLQSDFSFFLGTDSIKQQQLIRLYDYITDPALVDLFEKVEEKYPDNSLLSEDILSLISYLKAYKPNAPVPAVYTYISGLDYSQPVMYFDSILVISLDMYLGDRFDGYRTLGIPKYKRAHFRPEYIPVDIATQIAISIYPGKPEGKLIERMIHHGKQLYFKDALLPNTHDSLKIKYTASQLEWIRASEKMLWSFIIENELLFSGRYSKIKKLLSEGPFTSEFGRTSAPRIAQWIGWQIVRKYMEENPETSLNELMQMSDAQSILEESGYKP
jgi:hypothetical protein